MKPTDIKSCRTMVLALGVVALGNYTQLHAQATVTNGSPKSGIIRSAGGTVTSFSGEYTRNENLSQNARMLYVTGKQGWAAFPEVGRVVTNLPSAHTLPSFPEQARSLFSRLTKTNATKVADQTFMGLPGWEYQVVTTRQSNASSCVLELPVNGLVQTNIYLFLANPEFPLMLRRGASNTWTTSMDIVEASLDCPVSSELFVAPTNLKPTKPFNIPPIPLTIEVRQTRQSRTWGWSTIITNTYTTDGKVVTNHQRQLYYDSNGKQHYSENTEIKPFGQGIGPLTYPLIPPYWMTERKIGEDSILGMQAEVYEQAVLGRRYWVVDHPLLGAFSAKWSVRGDMPETNEVLRLEIPKETAE